MTLPMGSIQDGPLTTTLRDLALSTGWHDLRHFNLAGTEWQVILGHKRRNDPLRAVLPLPLHTTSLHPSSLKAIFSALASLNHDDLPPVIEPLAPSVEDLRRLAYKRSAQAGGADLDTETGPEAEDTDVSTEIDRDMIYMAIVTADSTVVYYRLSKGIKKPADIPDE